MNFKPELSEDELKTLLGFGQQSDGAGAGLAERGRAGAQQDSELLQALKEVVKTLTVRVASLEGEVGRLRAELAASRGELPPAGPRIVVEGVALPTCRASAKLPPPQPRSGTGPAAGAAAGLQPAEPAVAERLVPAATSEEPHAEAATAGPGGTAAERLDGAPVAGATGASLAALGLSRASRHRKPKKKGFFTRWFD